MMKQRIEVVLLTGGLGNQLFQIALADTLSKSNDVRVWTVGGGYRQGERLDFRDAINQLAPLVRNGLSSPSISRLINLVFRYVKTSQKKICKLENLMLESGRIFEMRVMHFHIRFFIGYWQDCRIILSNQSDFLARLENYLNINYRSSIYFKSIDLACHFRGGDFAIENKILSRKYYEQVNFKEFKKIFLISETREKLPFPESNNLEIIDSSIANTWQTLLLASRVSNFISSNSTLSWWMAALCNLNGGRIWIPDEFREKRDFSRNSLVIPGAKVLRSIYEI